MAGIFQKLQRWIDAHEEDPRMQELLQRIYALSAEVSLHSAVFGQRDTLIITERAIAAAAQAAEREQQQERGAE